MHKLLTLFCVLISTSFFASCKNNTHVDKSTAGVTSTTFISMTPSISEVFVYLDATKNLVGKTQYCNYKELDSIEVVGSMIAPSVEKISSLKPTAIMVLEDQKKYLKFPENFKIISLEQNSINSIFASVDSIAKILNIKQNKTKNDLAKIDSLTQKFSKKDSVKSYIAIVSANKINKNNVSFYISANNTYYNDILAIFNLKNAIIDENPPYQKQSLEYLQKTKPDYIFNFSNTDISSEILESISYKPKIITISTNFASIPGPISVQKLLDTLCTELE